MSGPHDDWLVLQHDLFASHDSKMSRAGRSCCFSICMSRWWTGSCSEDYLYPIASTIRYHPILHPILITRPCQLSPYVGPTLAQPPAWQPPKGLTAISSTSATGKRGRPGSAIQKMARATSNYFLPRDRRARSSELRLAAAHLWPWRGRGWEWWGKRVEDRRKLWEAWGNHGLWPWCEERAVTWADSAAAMTCARVCLLCEVST